MYKKIQVVMLPTNKKANIWLRGNRLEYNSSASSKINPQHLYFLSDEEIKEGDWYLVELFNIESKSTGLRVEKCKQIKENWINNSSVVECRHIENCKKIIATTDSSLRMNIDLFEDENISSTLPFPKPSQSFLEEYVKAYNEGKQIKEVMVEYEEHWKNLSQDVKGFDKLKVNSKDNTITTKQVKESWSRKEVISLIREFRNGLLTVRDKEIQYTNKWVKENL